MDLEKLRALLAEIVSLTSEPAAVITDAPVTEGGDVVTTTAETPATGGGNNGETTAELPQNDTPAEIANPMQEIDTPDITTITADALQYQELSNRIASQETQIKDVVAAVGEMKVIIDKISNSIITVEREIDTATRVPTVRSFADTLPGI